MPKTRRPRLSWFRFYADDFLGGTGSLTAPECGRYMLLLLHQWGTKKQQLIPGDPERLRVICRGEDPGPLVLSKFVSVDGGLRNQRLADEWRHANMEHEKGLSGNAARWDVPKLTSGMSPGSIGDVPNVSNPRTKNQEPRTDSTEGADLPADIRGERLLHESRVVKERRFYALIQRLSELQPDKDPPDIAREVTGYTAKDGHKVKGLVRPEGMTEERLDRSLGDAQWWIADLEEKQNGTTRK